MKKFLSTLLVFLAIPMAPYVPFAAFVVPGLLEKANGPNTKTQIDFSFRNAEAASFDMLILGNSRIYRGLNPDRFDVKSYNFSNDNDSYNQLYHKLVWADARKPIKYLVLGIDYFQFAVFSDQKNYAYDKYLGREYAADYPSKCLDWKSRLEFLDPKKMTAIIPRKHIPRLKSNGQLIYPGTASESDRVSRDVSMLDIQRRYFDKILEHCARKGIAVFLLMPPVLEAELREYKPEELQKFNAFISGRLGKGVTLLDFSRNADYKLSDFTDITHLNEAAADRFSSLLNDTLNALISDPGDSGAVRAVKTTR